MVGTGRTARFSTAVDPGPAAHRQGDCRAGADDEAASESKAVNAGRWRRGVCAGQDAEKGDESGITHSGHHVWEPAPVRELTVLGTCGGWPEAGRAASGFLLEADGVRLVLDLGHATLPRLLGRRTVDEVDAVIITHAHPDHCADLSALCRALLFDGTRDRRVPLRCGRTEHRHHREAAPPQP